MLVHDFGGDKIISVKVSPRDRDRIYVSQQVNGSLWRIQRRRTEEQRGMRQAHQL